MANSDIHILVVDDEPDWRRANQKVLARAGYRVDTAANAAEALAKLRATEYQLTVLDIGLPDRNGDEIVGEIKALRPDIYVIMLTGYATLDHAGRALAHGSVDVLEKIGGDADDPELAADLLSRVEELLASRDQPDEPSAP